MWWQKMLRGYVTQTTLTSCALRVASFNEWRSMGQCRSCRCSDRSVVEHLLDELCSTGNQCTCMTLPQRLKRSSRTPRKFNKSHALILYLLRRCSERMLRLELL